VIINSTRLALTLASRHAGRSVELLGGGSGDARIVDCDDRVRVILPEEPLVPIELFQLTQDPSVEGLMLFLNGMFYNNYPMIRDGCKNGLIPASVDYVELKHESPFYFPILGYLRLHFVPVNPSPLDLYCNEIFRDWFLTHGVRVVDTYLNAYQSLIATVYAFHERAPLKSDSYFAERAYSEQGENMLAAMLRSKRLSQDFLEFAASGLDITRPIRYIHFLNYLLSSDIGKRLLKKRNIRILDVGGCPYSSEHGAPAARYLLETLQRIFPRKRFEMVVSDKFYPTSFPITPEGEVDSAHPNLKYVQGDICVGSPERSSFDIVICNRVLTEPHFQGPDNFHHYEAARENLYQSLRGKNSVLFLDQGHSHLVEVWTKRTKTIAEGRYHALINRIDNWFLVSQLKIASDPRLKLKDAGRQINQIYSEKGIPPFLWATAAKYYKSLSDHDKRQAVILWRICTVSDGRPITREIKDRGIEEFLGGLSSGVRREVMTLIDRISNPHTIDLRGIARLDSILSRFGLKIDRKILMFSKLQTTSLDREITASLGMEETFFELDGMIDSVKLLSTTKAKRQYVVGFRLFKTREPFKVRKVMITVIPSAVGEYHIVKRFQNGDG